MHPIQRLIEIAKGFEAHWDHAYAGASVEIPSHVEAAPNTKVKPTGIHVVFKPRQGNPEKERGVFLVGKSIGTVWVPDAPAELLIRACQLLPELADMLEARERAIRTLGAEVADALELGPKATT